MEERRSLSLLSLSRLYRFTIISVRSESSMIGSRDELPVESLSYLFRRILKQLNVSLTNGLIYVEIVGQTFNDSFFSKFLVDTCPFMGLQMPVFWASDDVFSGF